MCYRDPIPILFLTLFSNAFCLFENPCKAAISMRAQRDLSFASRRVHLLFQKINDLSNSVKVSIELVCLVIWISSGSLELLLIFNFCTTENKPLSSFTLCYILFIPYAVYATTIHVSYKPFPRKGIRICMH